MQRHRGTTELERKKIFVYALKIADNSLVAKLLITLIVLFFWAAINEFAVFVFFFSLEKYLHFNWFPSSIGV